MREHGVRLHAVRVERNNLQIARAVAAAIDRVAACIDRMERTHHREVTRFVAAAKERHTLAVPVDVQQFPTRGVERKTVTLHGEHRAAKRLLKSGFKRGIGGVETAWRRKWRSRVEWHSVEMRQRCAIQATPEFVPEI